jgi:hypothetical protein
MAVKKARRRLCEFVFDSAGAGGIRQTVHFINEKNAAILAVFLW